MKNLLAVLLLFCMAMGYTQRDSIINLEEVLVSDSRLLLFSNGIKIKAINDSTLQKEPNSLTNTLRYNSSIYFKENGAGMVSSPSFRGTGASQTAVIWNGINVNSQLNGQVDFNTILPQNYDKISIRSGGGSTQYGTGAVGGSIHLENSLDFELPWVNTLSVGYGSFSTKNLNYKTKYGTDSAALSIGVGHISSQNDYKYLGTDDKNENGAYNLNTLDIGLGLLASDSNLIKLQHTTFIGDRDFSGTLTAPSTSNYKDLNSKSLLEWVRYKKNIVQRTKAAYLYEQYKYFLNKSSDNFSTNKAQTLLLNYDLKYRIKNLLLNGLVDYNNSSGDGTSIIGVTRNSVATTLLVSHTLSEKFSYGVNFRKDWVTDYNSPFVYALDGRYQITKSYAVTLNTSKNFRIPTFNDLYWESSGNKDLKPETSHQIELGQAFKNNSFKAELATFYITNKQLIQWRRNRISGVWSPVNIANAHQYGIESSISIQKKIRTNTFRGNATYAFTRATDLESNNQLMYVPKHKLTASLFWEYGKSKIAIQTLYNGLVYSTSDQSQEVDPYFLGNFFLEHDLFKHGDTYVVVALRINNILNTNYQNVAFRPMPNRNYTLQLNFKF